MAKRTRIPRLGLSLGQEIVYFVFVAVIPAIITCLELFSTSTEKSGVGFKITFSFVGSLLLVAIMLRKFVFKGYIQKLQAKCILLEHDYSLGNGNPDNARALWGKYNAIIHGYNAAVMLLSLGLFSLFVKAISDGLIKFQAAALLIFGSVLIGLFIKTAIFLGMVKLNESETETD